VEELAAASHRHADQFACYFGLCPRVRPRGDKKSVTHAPGLWADLDFKRFEDGEAGTLRSLAAFPLPPTWIVATGGGYHLYWQLREAVRADASFEGRLKAIAKALNADPAATERARVFRVPGSFNFKYQPEPQVRILRWPIA
jgi:putative DNA primase/helicase